MFYFYKLVETDDTRGSGAAEFGVIVTLQEHQSLSAGQGS